MTTNSDYENRAIELDEQARQARAMAAGEGNTAAQWLAAGLELPRKELYQEAESAERKAQTLRDYQRFEEQVTRAGAAPPEMVDQAELQRAKTILETNKPAIEALTSKELSPFVKIDRKTDSFTIDVTGAIKSGVDKDILKAAGISGAKQQIMKIRIRKEKEARKERGQAVKESRKAEEAAIRQGNMEEQLQPLLTELSRTEGQSKAFESQNTRLGDGNYISNADFEKLTPFEKGLARGSGGFAALEEYWQRKSIPKLSLPVDAKLLYEKSGPEDKFAILQSYGKLPANAKYTGSKDGEPTYRIGAGVESFVMSEKFRNIITENTLPLVNTIGNWDKMNAGEKSLSIIADVLFIFPFIRAASTGAKASVAVTRTGRLASAARGVGQELLFQARAPIDIILHPVGTLKGTARGAWDMIENIAHYKKIPQAVLTTTEGTVRIPVRGNLTAAEAMTVRNRLMTAIAGTGGDVVMEFNGMKFTLSRSALMKELGGGLTHATPQGDAFMDGLKVSWKSGKPMTEQGVFVSHEPLPRFVESSAFGTKGKQPSILIVSPETARDAINTSKIYKSRFGAVAELEKKFPVDYTLPKPQQVLFTRVGPERVKTMLLLEKPLSKAQIAKLKVLAIVEDLKAPFKPALLMENTDDYIKGASKFSQTLDIREYNALVRELERSGNRVIARNLRAVWSGLDNARQYSRKVADQERTSRLSPAGQRIGVGNIRVGSRIGTDVPRNALFTVHAEKIGRITQQTEKLDRAGSVRLTNNPERPYATTSRKGENSARSERADTTSTTSRAGRKEAAERATTTGRTGKGDEISTRTPRKGDETERTTRATGRGEKTEKRTDGGSTSDESREWTGEEIISAIAWKDGFAVHAIKAPYRRGIDEKSFHIDHVPPGLQVLDIKGKGSEQKTISVRGTVKRPITVDVGNQDKIITPLKGGRKVRITSRRDTKGTTSQLTVKRQPAKVISKKRGRQYITRTGGGSIISRRPIHGY